MTTKATKRLTHSSFLSDCLDGDHGLAPLWRERAVRDTAYGVLLYDPEDRGLDAATRYQGDAVSGREFRGEIWSGRIPVEISPAGLQHIVNDSEFRVALIAWGRALARGDDNATSMAASTAHEILARLVEPLTVEGGGLAGIWDAGDWFNEGPDEILAEAGLPPISAASTDEDLNAAEAALAEHAEQEGIVLYNLSRDLAARREWALAAAGE